VDHPRHTLTAFDWHALGGECVELIGMVTFVIGMIIGFNLGFFTFAVLQIAKT
jgi:hypothetical protein